MNNYEKVKSAELQCWKEVPAKGIFPYRIYRVVGQVYDEWDRTGKSLPIRDWKLHKVVCWVVMAPGGRQERFIKRRDAVSHARYLLGVDMKYGCEA